VIPPPNDEKGKTMATGETKQGETQSGKQGKGKTVDGTRRGGDPLVIMYVVAALAMLLGSLAVIVMIFIPRDETAPGEGAYVPGSIEGFRPLVDGLADVEPAGVVRTSEDSYRVMIEAFNWGYNPSEIQIDAGSEVTFRVRSLQDYHGFAIVGTDVIFSLPGSAVEEATWTFNEPGEYQFLCSDYCGAGHVTMTGKITVK
jgi:cytochrome c oxidase subunit 2